MTQEQEREIPSVEDFNTAARVARYRQAQVLAQLAEAERARAERDARLDGALRGRLVGRHVTSVEVERDIGGDPLKVTIELEDAEPLVISPMPWSEGENLEIEGETS